MKIKFLIVAVILATALFGFSFNVQAQSDTQTLIAQIQAQIQSLLQQIAQLQSQQNQNQNWCHTFNSNLQIGNSGSEVAALHEALRENGLYGNLSAFGTSDFDSDTVSHVKQFQAKYGISQIGIVGPITRAKLNSLYGCANSCIAEGGTVTGPVAPQYQTVCCPGLVAQYPSGQTGASGICIRPGNNCPQYSPPAPGWCANGTIISGGYNSAGCPNPPQCSTSSQISITGISGPNSLTVGQQGTWAVSATASAGSQLSYSVNWGDYGAGYAGISAAGIPFVQTSTFTHSYSSAGTYTVNFTVKSTRSVQCFAYPCPDPVEDIARASITVVVGNNSQPSITVTSPNGGEVWTAGTTHNITWTSHNVNNVQIIIYRSGLYTGGPDVITPSAPSSGSYSWTVPSNFILSGDYKITVMDNSSTQGVQDSSDNYFSIVTSNIQPSITVTSPNGGEVWTTWSTQTIRWVGINRTVDLYLNPEPPACIYSNPACSLATRAPYVLDKNIVSPNLVYYWIVATDIDNIVIPAGQYRMKICTAGSQTDCDVSDNYFTINPGLVY